ncbi:MULTISPECIES: hypothetical protein [Microcoleaceae]|nr:hypothetical protein [Tychonema sp. LEGE 06208]MBE9160808.1 hypothetical protein [Tychonema sp. LEGE 06208]
MLSPPSFPYNVIRQKEEGRKEAEEKKPGGRRKKEKTAIAVFVTSES